MMKVKKCDEEKKAISKTIIGILTSNELSYSEATEVLEIAQTKLENCKVNIN
ncbi:MULTISPECIES: hypothetical protein [Clostridium]|uniref:Uncharacterized protein n=1 Tax=Clostridium frigoriphilum TaxID=443253 RepID=A0ABU7UJV2_9CLOT|nr:hypothetical protein [Clostridium sp. DSM 17811]MBU3098396.1 hypothetical protein [Clostridium sp. DSM 17811]